MGRKSPKCFFLAGMSIMLVIFSAGFLAGQSGARAARQSLGLGMGFPQLLEMQQIVAGLNLTDAQKTQIKDILTQNKTQILQAARDVTKAQLDMMQGVQDAATELANAQSEAMNLRTTILGQISPVLTADQLAKVQQRNQLRIERLQKRLAQLNSQLGG